MVKRKMLFIFLSILWILGITGCEAKGKTANDSGTLQWDDLDVTGQMELKYATQFSVEYRSGGYSLITVSNQQRYLVIPQGEPIPGGLDEDICLLQQPMNRVYLAATAVMDLMIQLDTVDNIRLSGTDVSGWYLPEAREAMSQGKLLYAGKYGAPDYELLLSEQSQLALESTMIYHVPEVKEQLETLGIPVFVDYSSYEEHPLGRLEWIRLYGLLFEKEEIADKYYQEQLDLLTDLNLEGNPEKTVGFFYVSSNGEICVRKTDDYVTEMIRMGGGTYALSGFEEEENALATSTISMETFYEQARDADYLIYNSAVAGEIETVSQLIEKNELFQDFKAVENQNVWCTSRNMYQESTGIADMILDFNRIISNEQVSDDELTYLYRLR